MKAAFDKILKAKTSDIDEEWEEFLKTHKTKVSNDFACGILREQARKGPVKERNKWEKFQQTFCIPLHSTTATSKQTCTITTREGQRNAEGGRTPSTFIVWNGNGVRARWTSPINELKSLVQATDPDVFCFLESKTDSDKLLSLQGFEEWVNERGYKHLFCYWSHHEEKITRGCEGILIFCKTPCKVFYGMGDPELDKQARVTTVEFPNLFLIISYNPQGGVSQKSLEPLLISSKT